MPGLLLEPPRVVETIERLTRRIEARFPGSGLARIAGDLLRTAQSAAERSATFSRPIIPLRLLTGKVAAIDVQRFDDPAVLEAVGEIENLTTGLCQKIWQKLDVLQHLDGARHALGAAAPENPPA